MRRGIVATLVWSSALCVAACAADPCMSIIDPGMVVRTATGLRVDVYDASVTCANLATTPGAAPSSSRLFSPKQAIAIHVAPGKHAVVVTTFDDAALTQVSGTGCADVDASAGMHQCLSVTVVPRGGGGDGGGPSDGGPPGDLALPSTYAGLPSCESFCDCDDGTCSVGSCGPSCEATCSGSSSCMYTAVGAGTLVSCEGTTLCTVQCVGSCAVQCGSMASCRLQCAGDPSAHFVTGVATCP